MSDYPERTCSTYRHMIASPVFLNWGSAPCEQRSPTRDKAATSQIDRNVLTWTVLPSHLFHETVKLLGSVARVLRMDRNALLAGFAPGMHASWIRTIDFF